MEKQEITMVYENKLKIGKKTCNKTKYVIQYSSA